MLHRTVHSLVLMVTLAPSARGASPNLEQCLEASEASIELENRGSLRDTREALRTCAALSCPEQVRDECARRLALVEASIPSVSCEVSDESGRLLQRAFVSVDGKEGVSTAGEPIELEPGHHTLVVWADRLLPVTQTIVLKSREKGRKVRFILKGPRARAESSALPPRRVAALISGGVGVASLITSTVFTLVALNQKREASSVCPDATCPSALGEERWSSAVQSGNLATGFAIGSAATVAVAAGLWFSVPSRASAVAMAPTGLQFRTRF